MGRWVGLGSALILAVSCADSGGETAGSAGEAGEPGGGAPPAAGEAGSHRGGSVSSAGLGGVANVGGVGGASEPPGGATGIGGDDTTGQAGGGAGGMSGAGGEAGAGATACIDEFEAMPDSPLAPANAACGSCATPPVDGSPLGGACASAGDTPPANAHVTSAAGGSDPQPVVGAPCDAGWCASSVVKVTAYPGSLASDYPHEENTLAAGPANVAHMARIEHSVFTFEYHAVDPAGTVRSIVQIEADRWWYEPPPNAPFGGGPIGDPFGPVIRADPRPGKTAVYLAYRGVKSIASTPANGPERGPRFGVLLESGWSFEDLPAELAPIDDIQIDGSGAALVLTGGKIYRHVPGGPFDELRLPCGVVVQSFATDPSNDVYYLMDQTTSRLYRRAANGRFSWELPPHPGKVLFAGGTVHLVGETGVSYRVGSSWSTPIWPTTALGRSSDIDVAVDSCWAPHFTYANVYDTNAYYWEAIYTRWTARGFLSSHITWPWGDHPTPKVITTDDYAYVTVNNQFDAIPLR